LWRQTAIDGGDFDATKHETRKVEQDAALAIGLAATVDGNAAEASSATTTARTGRPVRVYGAAVGSTGIRRAGVSSARVTRASGAARARAARNGGSKTRAVGIARLIGLDAAGAKLRRVEAALVCGWT
jgi:hypothetical protein